MFACLSYLAFFLAEFFSKVRNGVKAEERGEKEDDFSHEPAKMTVLY